MTTHAVHLEPLDVLFFRDGRPFSASSRASGGLPTPQIVAGAVRTALLAKYGVPFHLLSRVAEFKNAVARAKPEAAWIGNVTFRGPWLHCATRGVLLPVPAVLHTDKKGDGTGVYQLAPKENVPGWNVKHHADRLPLWSPTDKQTEPAAGFLPLSAIAKFLDGRKPDHEQFIKPGDLYDFDPRTGIGIDPDRLVAQEAQIYGASFLALKPGVSFVAEVILPRDAPPDALAGIDVLAFGGEGRRVHVVKEAAIPWPHVETNGRKRLVLLTTPCLDHTGGIPTVLKDRVGAAAVPTPVAISGWDIAKGGPKPTLFAIPAGSVYFLKDANGLPESLDTGTDAELGYGHFLQGV